MHGSPVYLALDLGTLLGWARGSVDGPVASGTLDLSGSRYEGGGMRYVRFENHLQELLQGVDRVVFEEVRRHLGVDAAHIYGGLLGVLSKVCELSGIPYEGIPVGTWKKHAVGKGNANKEVILRAGRERWGPALRQDEADARFILEYALHQQEAA